MPTSRWLISRALVLVDELDRVLDRHDVLARVWLMWSIIAASVVDLPEPVVPVSRMIPRCSSASSPTTGGSASSSIVRILWGIARQTSEISAALAEGVDAEAGDALDFAGEVDLVLLGELVELDLVREELLQRGLGGFGCQLLGEGAVAGELAVDTEQRYGTDLEVEVGTLFGHQPT